MVSVIHFDLLPIIFAYTGLCEHPTFSQISRQCRKLSSIYYYHYFASLGKNDIIELFKFGCGNTKCKLVADCLKTSHISIDIIDTLYSFDYIYWILSFGDVEIIKLLSDKWGYPIDSMIWASFYGNIKMVEFLLTISTINPTDQENRAIHCALKTGHLEIARLLFSDPRVSNSISDKFKSKYLMEMR